VAEGGEVRIEEESWNLGAFLRIEASSSGVMKFGM